MTTLRSFPALGLILAIAGAIALPAEAAPPQFLSIDGSVHGDWDTTLFPNQTFDVPLAGTFIVLAENPKKVRIQGGYFYQAEVEWHCPFSFCPAFLLTPYPFEVDATVDLVADVLYQDGRTILKAPDGIITEDVWVDALQISYPRSRRVTLPDLVLTPNRWGFGGDWSADGPLTFSENGTVTELLLGGDY